MKHRSIAWTSLGLVALVLALLVAPASQAEGSLSGVTICLDPGHGGSDPGAVNEAFGLFESEINLDVSFALKGLLEADGADVVMTRTDDETYLENSDRYTFCNAEQATILVSVHTNSIDNNTSDGSMGLYVHEDDKALAKAIHETMYPMLRATLPPDPWESFVDFGLVRFNSGVMLKSDMPAAMMEPLFMSNTYEAGLLQQGIEGVCTDLSCRRGEIAQALHQGILHYFDTLGKMHVASVEMELGDKGPSTFVYTEVTIHDGGHNPVSGAVVSLVTTQPKGPDVSQTGMTGADGIVTFQLRAKATGSYESTVTDVSMSGWEYDTEANEMTGAELILK